MPSVFFRAALSCLLLGVAACDQQQARLEAVGTLEWDRIELSAEVNEPIVAIEAREGQPAVRRASRVAPR